LKKRSKKLLQSGAALPAIAPLVDRSFLVLFFKKEHVLLSCAPGVDKIHG